MIYTKNLQPMSALRTINPVNPKLAGERWQSLKHSVLTDAVEYQLHKAGYSYNGWRYYATKSGAMFAGSLDVIRGGQLDDIGAVLSFGVENSNVWASSVKYYSGIVLLKDSVGIVFYGGVLCLHETGLEARLEERLAQAIKHLGDSVKDIKKEIKKLQKHPVSEAECDTKVLEAARNELIPYSHTKHVFDDFRNNQDLTSWGLLTAFSKACQKQTPINQMRNLLAFKESLRVVPCSKSN